MDKREKQRQDSEKIIGWAIIGMIVVLLATFTYNVITKI